MRRANRAGRGRQRGRKCNALRAGDRNRRRQRSGAGPIDDLIADVIGVGVKTRGVQGQHVIGGDRSGAQFRAVAIQSFNHFDKRQRAGAYGNEAAQIILRGRMIGFNLRRAGFARGQRRAHAV